MAENISLSLQPRTALGKKNKALRRSGFIPVHVYGQGQEPLALQVEMIELRTTLRAAGATTPINVKVAGGKDAVTLVRDIAVHPVSGDLLHVDFMRVDISEEVQAVVPITLINEEDAPGIRGGAGIVTQGVYEISVLAKPFDIPSHVDVDCTVLVDLDADIKAGDLVLPAGVTLDTDPETRIAWIQPPRVIEETTAAEEGEAGEEAAEAGEESDEESKEDSE